MSDSDLSLSQLESYLWEAANILRGPVDAADFKTYVFPLLFFKRISDVFEEEYTAALAESDGDEEYARFPQNYRFQIPKDCHWNDVRVVAANVGQALQKAMRGIEKANPETLYGIFGDAGWTNKERLPDSLLRDLIEHFSRKQHLYSITSSARASSDGGTVRPSAMAVLRLITSSYFVGACTGRSAGFSPLRMRST